MKTKSLLLLTFLSVSFASVVAQDGFSEWEKTYFQKNANQQQLDFVKKIALPAQVKIPRVIPKGNLGNTKSSWDGCFRRSFAAFFTEAKSYRYNRTVALAYGLLNLGNYDASNYQKALKKQFNDTLWLEETFNLLLPIIKEGWVLLDYNTKKIYTAIVKHVDSYLRTFNYNAEKEYLKWLVERSREDEFVLKKGNLAKHEFRKAEAFIYRRIDDAKKDNGNWTIEWARKMIRKIRWNLVIV